MMDYFNYQRRKSSEVHIGNTPMGGNNPIRVQSMANVSTMETEAAVQQAIRMIQAGAEYVRFTTQGEREAHNLGKIRKALNEKGYTTPLVADVHFNPKAADAAATEVEKVRVNPGNYVDRIKTFSFREYTDDEYAQELQKIRERFIPFLNICKEHHTAIRIGVNHGSLSDRIMSRYGDTPRGMVESCMEFLRICVEEHFMDVVISIKASNPVIMVKTVHLLIQTMEKENMYFPLHLGVTEAGDGEDGRIKSAVGIGTLLADGIGDTIRVSLSEDPEAEIPVAQKLVDYIQERENHPAISANAAHLYNPLSCDRRFVRIVENLIGGSVPVVISDRSTGDNFEFNPNYKPDYIYIGQENPDNLPNDLMLIVDAHFWQPRPNTFPYFIASEAEEIKTTESPIKFIRLTYEYQEKEKENMQLKAAADLGALFLDGFGEGIMIQDEHIESPAIDETSFGILQAAKRRISKTEYISCPSCGRTLYNIQATIARIKAATSHLKGLKIGIMGCIVNGPGEMADADYGYVGAGRNQISLYKGKECILRNIPEEEAVEKLIQLIKDNGDWQD